MSSGCSAITSSAARIACAIERKWASAGKRFIFFPSAAAMAIQSGTAAIASASPAMKSFQVFAGPAAWASMSLRVRPTLAIIPSRA